MSSGEYYRSHYTRKPHCSKLRNRARIPPSTAYGQIVFAPNGQMGVAIDNDGVSTFEEAAARIATLKATIRQMGVPLVFTGEVEQHVHTAPQGRLLAHSHH